MIRNTLLIGVSILFLFACQNSLDELTPIETFPQYILDEMDTSVDTHLNELIDAVKQEKNQDNKRHFAAWLKLAHALHGYELLDGAESAYLNALLFNQRISVVKYQLAHLYRLQSNYQQSNELLNSISEDVSDYSPIFNNLAENLYDQGLLVEAKRFIQKSLEIDKNNVYALQISANIDSQMNNTEAAISALQQALVLQPNATKLYSNLAQLYQQQGQQNAAAKALQKSGNGTLATSDPWLSEVTKDLRGFNQFISKAQAYMNKRDFKTALAWAEKAASDRPNGFTTQMFLGVLKVRLNQSSQALQHFGKAYQQRPDDFKVNLNLGTVNKELGQYNDSIDYFNRAIEIDANHLPAKLSLADAYCLNNQYGKSMELLEKLKLTNSMQHALYIGLKCKIQHKRFSQAFQWVKENIESVKNNDEFIEYAILLLAATPIEDHRNGEQAMVWLEKLMKKQATNKRKQLLIMALMTSERFDEAQKWLNTLQPSKSLFIPKASLQQLLNNKVPFILNAY